jgi:hypothetical protein
VLLILCNLRKFEFAKTVFHWKLTETDKISSNVLLCPNCAKKPVQTGESAMLEFPLWRCQVNWLDVPATLLLLLLSIASNKCVAAVNTAVITTGMAAVAYDGAHHGVHRVDRELHRQPARGRGVVLRRGAVQRGPLPPVYVQQDQHGGAAAAEARLLRSRPVVRVPLHRGAVLQLEGCPEPLQLKVHSVRVEVTLLQQNNTPCSLWYKENTVYTTR